MLLLQGFCGISLWRIDLLFGPFQDNSPKSWVLTEEYCQLIRWMSLVTKSNVLWLSWLRICLQCGRPGFDPWVGKIPWKRERLPIPVLWPVEFHGLYSPWGGKELDTTERFLLSNVLTVSEFFKMVQPKFELYLKHCYNFNFPINSGVYLREKMQIF